MGALIETGVVVTGTAAYPMEVVSDVEWWETGEGLYLIVASEATGALTSWDISAPGAPVPVDVVAQSALSGTVTVGDLVRLPGAGGDRLVTLGRYDDNFGLYEVGADGSLSLQAALADAEGHFERGLLAVGVDTGVSSFLYSTGFGLPGYDVFRIDAAGNATWIQTMEDSGFRRLDDVTAMHADSLHGINMLFVASAFDGGIHATTLQNNGITRVRDRVLPSEAEGFAHVTAMDSLEIGDRAFLVVGAAQSDSLSVFRVSAGYQMTLVDVRYDTRETRFGGVQDIETFQAGGRSFVVAGGADDGVSLFEIDHRGRLHHLETIADEFDTTLQNVSSLSVRVVGEVAHVYVGSEADHGVTELVIDLSRTGQVVDGGTAAERLDGTAGDDVLMGRGHSDEIYGGAGDDVLVDGRGRDVMTGGDGADIFRFIEDGRSDFVMDFEPGVDRIDLTDFDVDHVTDFVVAARPIGAVIIVGEDVIRLVNPDGGPYDMSLFDEHSFIFG